MKTTSQEKVFVGMSGGVDSSVSALLLKEAGYDVVGVFIKVWQADFLPCSWRDERRDAMRAAAHIGIPLITLDLEKEYKQEVIDYMIREYSIGRIPNPDVMCNKYVKFGGFLNFAKAHGAHKIATGHYAQIKEHTDGYSLHVGRDKEKDQSYFLWTLTKEELSFILFPVGHLEKKEVRALAEKHQLPNAEKKDSQGLCFMGPVDMETFLTHYLHTSEGRVLDVEGKSIGTHKGALLYAIGQRHGFQTTKTSASGTPYFVVKKDIDANTIIVAHQDPSQKEFSAMHCTLSALNITDIKTFIEHPLSVRIRYRGELYLAQVTQVSDEGGAEIHFVEPVSAISRGQSAVIYAGDVCLGGGVIESCSE